MHTKRMKARFAGRCAGCPTRIYQGAEITRVKTTDVWSTYHDRCAPETVRIHSSSVTPLASSEREPLEGKALIASFTGEKAEQFSRMAMLAEHWDGEPEITFAAAERLHEQWEAGTWKWIEREAWM